MLSELCSFFATMEAPARVVKLVDTADLKSAAFLNKGRTGSIPVPGTKHVIVYSEFPG